VLTSKDGITSPVNFHCLNNSNLMTYYQLSNVTHTHSTFAADGIDTRGILNRTGLVSSFCRPTVSNIRKSLRWLL